MIVSCKVCQIPLCSLHPQKPAQRKVLPRTESSLPFGLGLHWFFGLVMPTMNVKQPSDTFSLIVAFRPPTSVLSMKCRETQLLGNVSYFQYNIPLSKILHTIITNEMSAWYKGVSRMINFFTLSSPPLNIFIPVDSSLSFLPYILCPLRFLLSTASLVSSVLAIFSICLVMLSPMVLGLCILSNCPRRWFVFPIWLVYTSSNQRRWNLFIPNGSLYHLDPVGCLSIPAHPPFSFLKSKKAVSSFNVGKSVMKVLP